MENPIGPWPIILSWYRYPDRFVQRLTVYCYGYRPDGTLTRYECAQEVSEAELAYSTVFPNLKTRMETNGRNTVIVTMQEDV